MKNENDNTRTLVKRAQSRFIQIDELCIANLSMYAMAIYMQLRLLSDFTKAYDEIEITIDCLAKATKMCRRKVFEALSELETTHFIIQRLNYHHFRYGKVNSYNVARDYNFFKSAIELVSENKQLEQVLNTGAPKDTGVQSSYTRAPKELDGAPKELKGALKDIPNNNIILSEVYHIKQNKEPVKKPVSIFSDTDSIKTHVIQTIAKRGAFVEEDLIEQIVFYVGKDRGDKLVIKKINIALKCIREKKWNIPQGYKGITSQSIREKEEQQLKEKQEQYKQEARANKAILNTIAKGEGFEEFSNMFNKMKKEVIR